MSESARPRLWRRLWDRVLGIRYRLLLVNVLIVGVPLAGVSFARFYERAALRVLEDDMVHQAELLRQVLVTDPTGLRLADRAPLLRAAAHDTRTRIRLLDDRGRLAADSHADGPPEGPEKEPALLPFLPPPPAHVHVGPPLPLDLADRGEVKHALAGDYAAATRVWRDGNRVFLFGALPIRQAGKVTGVIYVTRSTNPVRAAMHHLRSTLFLILALALGTTAILSLFLAATISRPLSRLTAIAERIAAGDRSQRLGLDRRDEIGQLARAFDAMERKLDERARYIAELAANISHEFKSPLTSVRGAAELLLDGAADDPAARQRFLENILADARRLDRLVTRLLELSRVEADAAPWEPLDYRALVEETALAVQGPASATIAVSYRASAHRVVGRRAHLASALGNLVDNARRHAAPGSVVRVEVGDVDGRRLRTTVHNDGAPITAANLPRVWDRFFTTRSNEGGTGLGLPIVASVIAAHGGTVGVTSSEAEGTEFFYELPADVDQA